VAEAQCLGHALFCAARSFIAADPKVAYVSFMKRSLSFWRIFFSPFNLVAISDQQWRVYVVLNSLNWAILFSTLCVVVVTTLTSHLRLSGSLIPLPVLIVFVCLALAIFYTAVRNDRLVVVLSNTLGLFIGLNFVIQLLSYVTQFWGSSFPLRDETFAKIDTALGFAWSDWAVWSIAHPQIGGILRSAYISPQYQFVILLFLQFPWSWELRIQRGILATQICGLITCIIAAILPALDAYNYFNPQLIHNHVYFSPFGGNFSADAINNLRGISPVLPFDYLQGLIALPSFHTILGILLIWAFWPNWITRSIAIVINGLMILATPVFGAHYAIDVLAGAAVALAGLLAASAVQATIHRSQRQVWQEYFPPIGSWRPLGIAASKPGDSDHLPPGPGDGHAPEAARRT
jgi:hypothetical protein